MKPNNTDDLFSEGELSDLQLEGITDIPISDIEFKPRNNNTDDLFSEGELSDLQLEGITDIPISDIEFKTRNNNTNDLFSEGELSDLQLDGIPYAPADIDLQFENNAAKKAANIDPNRNPYQHLIDEGNSEPTEEQQRLANNKYHRNLKNKNEPLSSIEKWAFSLYRKNIKSSRKAKKAGGINPNAKSWQYLINQRHPEPTEEQQKLANNKYQRNLKNKNEPLSDIEKWASSLYFKKQRASRKARKAAGINPNAKSWQYLIDQRNSEPTEEQQRLANNKYQRNLKNKNEPLSDIEKWARSLYKKKQRASCKARKKDDLLKQCLDNDSSTSLDSEGLSKILDLAESPVKPSSAKKRKEENYLNCNSIKKRRAKNNLI